MANATTSVGQILGKGLKVLLIIAGVLCILGGAALLFLGTSM